MKTYFVTYDLNAPEQDYPKIVKALEAYENSFRILKSQWFILSSKTAEEIFNNLKRFIDEDDELFVCEVTRNCFGKFNEIRPRKWVDNLHRS